MARRSNEKILEEYSKVILYGSAIIFGFVLNVGAQVFYKYFVEFNFYLQVFFLVSSLVIVGFFMWFVNKFIKEHDKIKKESNK